MAPGATQQEVYDRAVAPIVDDVMLGYNGSVMAYGQTGAGKTYTLANMEADHVGMIPRALADIFNKAAADVVHSYRVYMSYVQIYMEVIKDLLLPSAEQLAIREDANGVFLSNVHEEQVRLLSFTKLLYWWGEAAATDMVELDLLDDLDKEVIKDLLMPCGAARHPGGC
jgi:kinesin family protein 5